MEYNSMCKCTDQSFQNIQHNHMIFYRPEDAHLRREIRGYKINKLETTTIFNS